MKWSYSAHTTMGRCQRLLAFNHVTASHNAHDPQRREAYILKQLQHVSAWQGSLIHTILSTHIVAAVRSALPLCPGELTMAAQALAREQLAFSAARRYREPGQTKSAAGAAYCALVEHEHGRDLSPAVLATVDATLARCFEHLAGQTPFLDSLYAGSGHVAETPVYFRLDGATITATPDLVFARRGGKPTVVDWKVAESETSDYTRQLHVYALVLSRCGRWDGVAPHDIDLYEVNLLTDRVTRHPVDAGALEDAEDFVYRSVVDMRALLGDGGFAQLDMGEFEVAERPTTCAYCPLGALCVRMLTDGGRDAEAQLIQGRLF